jgi:hypothetical protein
MCVKPKDESREGNTTVRDGSQVGVMGDHAKIDGGIHFHIHSESPDDASSKTSVSYVQLPTTEQQLPEPRPHSDPADWLQPGGAVDVDSRFYIQRQADQAVRGGVHRHRGLVTLQGPRQTGKTSMMLRLYASASEAKSPLRPVFIDFQALSQRRFQSLATIWRSILTKIDAQLKVGTVDDSAGGGVFKGHLDPYLAKLQDQPELVSAMKQVLAGAGCPDVRLADRLAACRKDTPAATTRTGWPGIQPIVNAEPTRWEPRLLTDWESMI